MLIPVVNWESLRSERGFKAGAIALVVVIVIGGAGMAGYYLWPEAAPKPPPPIETATTQEARDYLASEDFKRLPADQRNEWMDQHRQRMSQMDEEERRKLFDSMDDDTHRRIRDNMRQVREERMSRDIETYHSLPESQREQFLDEKIDEMQSRRRGGGRMGRGPRGGPPPDGNRGGRNAGRDRGRGRAGQGPPRGSRRPGDRMLRMPADKRAEFTVFRKAMAKRMAERGISPPGPPGPPPRP